MTGRSRASDPTLLFSTTNGAEQSGLAARRRRVLRRRDVIEQLARIGDLVSCALDVAAPCGGVEPTLRPAAILPPGACPCAWITTEALSGVRTLFHQELFRHGVFMPWLCPP